MKKRILAYLAIIDNLLLDDESEGKLNYERLKKEHLTQIEFFMHERLVHLLVTLAFALFAFIVFALLVVDFSPMLVLLLAALMVLLVPYIMHYYLLENGVQKMYEQYDEMERRLQKDNRLQKDSRTQKDSV